MTNVAPMATITPASYSATEQTVLDLKNNGLSVSDADGGSGSETVTLSVSEGSLAVTPGTSGASVSGSGTGLVTISGTVAQIDALLNTDGTSTVSYIDNTDTPSASTPLTLTIHDNGNTGGGDLSSVATSTINITAVNDAPVATITPVSYSGIPNTALDLKNKGMSVGDIDGNGGSETVTLSVSSGTLTVTPGTSGAGVSNSGTNSVTITGTIAEINALLNTDASSTVSFVDTSSGAKTLTLAINDNGHSGGAAQTAQDTAQISLDQPAVVDLNGAAAGTDVTVAYTENNVSFIVPAGTVSDVDSANFNGGSLTVHVASGDIQDQFFFLTDGTVSVSGNTVSVGGHAVGFTTGGNSGDDFVVSFNTADATPAAVTALIQHLSYENNSDDPAASRTITFTVDDGSGFTASAVATVNITAVNDAPQATLPQPLVIPHGGDFYAYNAGEQTPLNLKNTGASVSDRDSDGGSETATLSVGEGTLTVTAGSSGAAVSGSGTGSVTISGTIAQIDALLNTDGTSTVSYIDNNDNPAASTILTLAINDNGHTGTGGALSGSSSTPIIIAGANDAPVATITPANYAATEQTVLDLKNNGLSVSDVDGNSGSETVTLSVGEGTLAITAGTSGATVSGSGTGSATISGTIAQIDALLNTDGTSTLSYIDNSDTPAASAVLTLSIHDNGNTGGGDLSSTDTATINITAVNHAPGAFDFNFDNNGNGHADLLLQNSSSGDVSTWESGQPAGAGTVATAVPASWHLDGIGDFDGNGKGDILWENNDGRVAIWDDGVTGHLIATGMPASWHVVGTGDFDGNGKSDILWQNDNGTVAIWDNAQTGHTVAGQGSMMPSTMHVVGTGDFDGNGKTDVLWQNSTNGALTIWNNGQPASATTLAASMPASWHVVGVGDFDGNGKSDIVWHNDNGTVAIWDDGQTGHIVAGSGAVLPDWHILA